MAHLDVAETVACSEFPWGGFIVANFAQVFTLGHGWIAHRADSAWECCHVEWALEYCGVIDWGRFSVGSSHCAQKMKNMHFWTFWNQAPLQWNVSIVSYVTHEVIESFYMQRTT